MRSLTYAFQTACRAGVCSCQANDARTGDVFHRRALAWHTCLSTARRALRSNHGGKSHHASHDELASSGSRCRLNSFSAFMDHSCLAGLDACGMLAGAGQPDSSDEGAFSFQGENDRTQIWETAEHARPCMRGQIESVNLFLCCVRTVRAEAASFAWMHGSLEDVEAAVGKFSGGHFAYLGVQSRRESLSCMSRHEQHTCLFG